MNPDNPYASPREPAMAELDSMPMARLADTSPAKKNYFRPFDFVVTGLLSAGCAIPSTDYLMNRSNELAYYDGYWTAFVFFAFFILVAVGCFAMSVRRYVRPLHNEEVEEPLTVE